MAEIAAGAFRGLFASSIRRGDEREHAATGCATEPAAPYFPD